MCRSTENAISHVLARSLHPDDDADVWLLAGKVLDYDAQRTAHDVMMTAHRACACVLDHVAGCYLFISYHAFCGAMHVF